MWDDWDGSRLTATYYFERVVSMEITTDRPPITANKCVCVVMSVRGGASIYTDLSFGSCDCVCLLVLFVYSTGGSSKASP